MSALVEPAEFREAMAQLVAPITIVTTVDADGARWGFTASAVTSVSLDPPLVLVGVARTSSCHPAMTRAAEFVINVLGESLRDVAVTFATSGLDRFAAVECARFPDTALPCLPDATCLVRCHRHQVVPAGDHDLVIGRVAEVVRNPGPDPLLWYRRGFHTRAR